MAKYHRGQVLPIWVFGCLAITMLIGFLLSYSNLIIWKIHAQTAADAVAQAVLVPQEERWNWISVELYSTAVEEYRVRRLIDSYVLDVQQNGGCAAAGTCDANYPALQTALLRATQRYTNDVNVLQSLAAYADFSHDQSDAKNVLGLLQQNCGKNNGSDCSFAYSYQGSSPIAPTSDVNLHDVALTSGGIVFQSMSKAQNAPTQNGMYPATAQIVACRWVNPPFPSFFGVSFPRVQVIAYGAATSVPVTSEWMSPGVLTNPADPKGGVYQGEEDYVTPYPDPESGIDWYNVIFGDRNWTASPSTQSYTGVPQGNDFTTYLSWWGSIPVKPTITMNAASLPCANGG